MIFFSYICSQHFHAYDFGKFSFELDASVGLKSSVISEYVYTGKYTLSRLDWQDNALGLASLNMQMSLFNVFVRGGVLAGMPIKSGIMEDYDFLLLTENPTHYSKHDMYSDRFVQLSVDLGYKFNLKKVELLPSIGLIYKSQKWTGSNGFSQYSSKTKDENPYELTWSEPKSYFTGHVIDYDQRIYFLSLGTTGVWHIRNKLNFLFGAAFYPYMFAEALDKHFLRGLQFYDVMNGGLGVSLSAGMEYNGAFLQLKYEYYKSFYGKSYQGAIGSSMQGMSLQGGGSGSGTDSSVFTLMFGYRFH